jgi:transketolase
MRKNIPNSNEPVPIQDYENNINSCMNKVNSKKSDIRRITAELEQTLHELPPEVTQKVAAIIDLRKKQDQALKEIDEYNEELWSNQADLHFARMLEDITHRMTVSERLQEKIKSRTGIQR